MCQASGYVEQATVVDHKMPHKGDWNLFWDETNWQPLCGPHHNATKQRLEVRGGAPGCDRTGQPLDPTHPWHRQRLAESS
jgi:5-methylcytosine-specific restriction endonuclease McrA